MQKQYIIGIGLSAGGLEPLKEIIKNLNPNLNATYIIAQHHQTDKNNLKTILEPLTKVPILDAKDDETIKPKTIYICPSNKHITIVDDKIELYDIENENFKPSINWFFESLSKYNSKAIAIILSGALNDGSNGILNIKLCGGLIIVQDPKTAKFPMMPQNAIDTKLVDFILPPKEIAPVLNNLSKIETKNNLETLEEIFDILNEEFQINFNDYKLNTLLRRIERRMVLNKIKSLSEYTKFLKKSQKEKKLLFDDLLIVVTSFYRNKEAFIELKKILLEYMQDKKELKVWNIGCATGEESYSLAILIQSIIDENNLDINYHIFSTDLSQKAIDIARNGIYPKYEVENSVSVENIKYFQKEGDNYIPIKSIRQKISFAVHNILTDTPLTNMDLIVCRNLLIYFKPEAQSKVFKLANYALKENGILFIGKSESIQDKDESLFKILNNKHKIYQKNISTTLFPISHHLSIPPKIKIVSNTIIDIIKDNLNKIFNTFVIIDTYGNILYTAGEYDKYLKLPKGTFNNNIFSFIDEDLNIPLHTIITQTKEKFVSLNYKIRLNNNKIQYINLISIPLQEFRANAIGIFFIPSSSEITIDTPSKDCTELEHELIEMKQKLKHTLEELNTTNEELQTSNEELQSSNEELITTNEELRSVNESLNKSNAELQNYKTKLEDMVEKKTKEVIKHQKIRTAIFENTNNLIVIIENNKIIDSNKAFKEFFENNNLLFKLKNSTVSIYDLIKLKSPIKIKTNNKIFLVKISNLEKNIFALNFIDITIEERYIETLQKELDKKIKQIRKKDIMLQNEYKLARMGEMLSNISHQYRQSLHRLSLTIANLEMNLDRLNKEEVTKCIDKSNETIQYLSNTIDDFKNLFQPNYHKTIINLYELVVRAINFIEIDKIVENINIKIKIPHELQIATYANDLNHVLLNLLHNAKDAILETKPKNPYIKISAKQKENDIIIKVKNNGGSIKNMDILFQPYVSTKKTGFGIGLYMSKIIVKEKLNGKLWAKNRKNGATFYIRIKNERNL